MNRLTKRMLFTGALMAAVLAVGTTGFVLIDDYPVFDAFYMTVFTVTTVGYSELHPLSQAGRVFNTFIIFFGVTVMFFAIGAMTQAIIQLELGDVFDKRRMRRMIDKRANHYIICGFGRVGRGAAEELRAASVAFVIVDRDPERVDQAVKAGMLALAADATRDETLHAVGVTRARGMISALGTDADNLFVTLSAKTLNPMLNLAARVSEEAAEQKLRRAGADAVFAPYAITGHRLAQALPRPHVSQFLDFTDKDLGTDVAIEQVRVKETSEYASKSLQQTQLRRDVGVVVLAIRKSSGEMLFNPPAEAEIQGGDYLIVMGRHADLRKLEGLLTEVHA
ncbi:MAG: potassium channel protein [Acidobacteriales bacterium]|nr:potassium channel protein [Terriglobales bacterium]